MKKLALTVILALAGCATPQQPVPVIPRFPDAPPVLLERCPQLKPIDNDRGTLREFLKTVIENYATYYQCADKAHAWQDWYREVKKYYEDLK